MAHAHKPNYFANSFSSCIHDVENCNEAVSKLEGIMRRIDKANQLEDRLDTVIFQMPDAAWQIQLEPVVNIVKELTYKLRMAPQNLPKDNSIVPLHITWGLEWVVWWLMNITCQKRVLYDEVVPEIGERGHFASMTNAHDLAYAIRNLERDLQVALKGRDRELAMASVRAAYRRLQELGASHKTAGVPPKTPGSPSNTKQLRFDLDEPPYPPRESRNDLRTRLQIERARYAKSFEKPKARHIRVTTKDLLAEVAAQAHALLPGRQAAGPCAIVPFNSPSPQPSSDSSSLEPEPVAAGDRQAIRKWFHSREKLQFSPSDTDGTNQVIMRNLDEHFNELSATMLELSSLSEEELELSREANLHARFSHSFNAIDEMYDVFGNKNLIYRLIHAHSLALTHGIWKYYHFVTRVLAIDPGLGPIPTLIANDSSPEEYAVALRKAIAGLEDGVRNVMPEIKKDWQLAEALEEEHSEREQVEEIKQKKKGRMNAAASVGLTDKQISARTKLRLRKIQRHKFNLYFAEFCAKMEQWVHIWERALLMAPIMFKRPNDEDYPREMPIEDGYSDFEQPELPDHMGEAIELQNSRGHLRSSVLQQLDAMGNLEPRPPEILSISSDPVSSSSQKKRGTDGADEERPHKRSRSNMSKGEANRAEGNSEAIELLNDGQRRRTWWEVVMSFGKK